MLGKLVAVALVVWLVVTMFVVHGHRQYAAGGRDLLIKIEQARVQSNKDKQRIDDAISNLGYDDLLNRAISTVQP